MGLGELIGLVGEVVGAEDHELGALGYQAFGELGYGGAGTVGGVGLIDVDELGAGDLGEDVLHAVVVSLAPAMVVVGADHHEADGKIGAGGGGGALGERRHPDNRDQQCERELQTFLHSPFLLKIETAATPGGAIAGAGKREPSLPVHPGSGPDKYTFAHRSATRSPGAGLDGFSYIRVDANGGASSPRRSAPP